MRTNIIRDNPDSNDPGDRMITCGAAALSASEHLSLILVDNNQECARALLLQFGTLKAITQAYPDDLAKVPGMTVSRVVRVMAMAALASRLQQDTAPLPTVRRPQDVYEIVGSDMRYLSQEQFRILLLNTKGGVFKQRTITQGSLNASIVEAREVYREAIASNAASIIAVHNHPTGDPAPSAEDIALTKRLAEAGSLVGIDLLDHVIIGDGRWCSLKEKSLF